MSLDQTLEERGSRYGKFSGHAEITQAIKRVMRGQGAKLTEAGKERLAAKWEVLTDSQREALEMAAHKIGRILNGDPNYDDSWVDIAGYAQLIVQELRDE